VAAGRSRRLRRNSVVIWHTINDTVVAYGTALVNDPDRVGPVEALGLDETLFARLGSWHTQEWSTQIVDVGRGQLLDVIPGRSASGACEWLALFVHELR